MPFRIVVPVDGSEASSNSLSWAIAFARRTASPISVCSVFNPMLTCAAAAGGALIDPQPMLESLEADARTFVTLAVAESVAGKVAAASAVLEGEPSTVIRDFAQRRGADLIVLGTHGRHGFALGLVGSVTDDVVRSTDIAVVAVRPQTSLAITGPIVVAVDDSPASAAAATFALGVATALGSALHLVHVVEGGKHAAARTFNRVLAAAAAAAVACTSEVRHGDILGNLNAVAAERGASLVATGTHGRGPIGRLFVGSVAEGLLRVSPVPVLIVRRAA